MIGEKRYVSACDKKKNILVNISLNLDYHVIMKYTGTACQLGS